MTNPTKSRRTETAALPTSELFAQTHRALCWGRWADARVLLDLLGRRSDNREYLPAYSAYDQGHAGERAQFAAVLQDRINLVNRKAGGL